MNIACYGGTFDPPTKAHGAIIEALAAGDTYDEVWVMPSADRVDKPGMSAEKHRLKMVAEMLGEISSHKVVLSDFEIQLGEPTQTMRTHAELTNKYPKDTFWFVFGADSYNDMPNWENGSELRATMHICVIPRIGHKTPKPQKNVHVLTVPNALELATSSTEVRRRARQHKSIDAHVSSAVQAYVLAHALYL